LLEERRKSIDRLVMVESPPKTKPKNEASLRKLTGSPGEAHTEGKGTENFTKQRETCSERYELKL